MTLTDDRPWVEKYRPVSMEDVVLSASNRTILERIIASGRSPHLLFHGPPGTGKTTSAMNLVDAIHARHAAGGRECLIHLNASDDRGVDVIRQQIHRFVNSEGLFKQGARFVILDEADYMTRCAQQSLRRLIQTSTESGVTFCLICNYATRIDAGLREELVTLRFHSLPWERIMETLVTVAGRESLELDDTALTSIMRMYGSDVRSMINHMQAHRHMPSAGHVSPYAYWEEIRTACRRGEGAQLSGGKLLAAAQAGGLPINLFMRGLINSAIRDRDPRGMDGARLLRLAESLVDHHQAEEGLLAEHCALELAASLSPHLSARSRSLALQELGGDGERGNPKAASVDSSRAQGVLSGIGSGAETPDIL